MIEKARARSHFKLVIVDGKAYVERYDRSYQTRDLFTWWGVVQLLRRYPGKVPDLELVFNCHDQPLFSYVHANATDPGLLFGYCGDDNTVDIAFPDWSFWGWPEVNIKPWEHLVKDLEEGNKKMGWVDSVTEPYAYWKGNPGVAWTRRDLMKCNPTDKQDWNARLFVQDWHRETKEGFKNSDLASQCTHRFKIYIEGNAWSVSEKYILSCDSLTLLVNPRYYDFFSRGLKPMQHYWPIKDNDKCRSIKHAVDWGNIHQKQAQDIGKAAVEFIKEELKMDNVYDYMFHLLNEYAKLLKFKPTIPQNATELCLESMFCPAKDLEKKYMRDSMVKYPSNANPCTMPPPFNPSSLFSILEKKADSLKQVDMWEKIYWENQNKQR
nr:O-glucosyltransferase rumi homolog [Ziziphus jujuba var. spinosa]